MLGRGCEHQGVDVRGARRGRSLGRIGVVVGLASLLGEFFSPLAPAQVSTAPATSAASDRANSWHDWLYQSVQEFIEGADRRLGESGADALPVASSPFRLGATFGYTSRAASAIPTLDVAVDADLHLPNIERRLRLFLTSAPIGEDPSAPNSSEAPRLGLRTGMAQSIDMELGVKVALRPDPFASLGWHTFGKVRSWELYPSIKLFAEVNLGVGATSTVTFDHWSGTHLLRESLYGQWLEREHATEWTESVIVARVRQLIQPNRRPLRVVGTDLGAGQGLLLLVGGATTERSDYREVEFFYKRPLLSHWLFASFAPLIRWERDNQWKPAWGAQLGFDALFWGAAGGQSH